MDTVFECAANFNKMINTQYHFVVSKNRKLLSISLNFTLTDFYHLAGFQYLTDLDISKNRNETIPLVLSGKISDKFLSASVKYHSNSNDEKDIYSRINALNHLEEYIDTDNLINIFSLRNTPWINSLISAEYVIKSRLPNSLTDVFIFLRKRIESDFYCIVSFFVKKQNEYGGDKLYWMLKEKFTQDSKIILYQHPNYKGKM